MAARASTGARRATPLAAFLQTVRPPLEYLASAAPATAARTQLPGAAFAARGRETAATLPDGARRETLETLCAALAAYETTAAAARPALVRRCQDLVAQLSAGEGASPAQLPTYQRSGGDVAVALAELAAPVQFAHGVGPRRAPELGKFGIQTVEDLLYHLPFRYEDRRRVITIAAAVVGEEAGIAGEIVQMTERVVGRARRRILEAVLRDETGLLALTWYHQVAYFRDRFRRGQRCLVYGRVERDPGGAKRIVHPDVDLAPQSSGGGVLPVYNKPTSMTVGQMRKLAWRAVADFAARVPSVLPQSLVADFADLGTALRAAHRPQADADVDALNRYDTPAHRALVFDELFFLQLGLCLRRRHNTRERGLAMPCASDGLARRLAAALPFALTGAQRRVVEEIAADMARPHPMHRLVQGDVGSGKTVVGLFAALVAVENRRQAAFMAPTELLAEQHFRTVEALARPLGVRCELVVGEGSKAQRAAQRDALASGAIQIAVGTHALIQESVEMPHLGLGIIDEQHRFGVLQRAALRRLGSAEAKSPDILLMTATPIPRTLAMTVYGDLDVSVLDELPAGRQPVRTMIFSEAERARVYRLVCDELDRGRQGYVVYPLVEASERSELLDATTMARELGRTVFADYRVGLVHGRMKPDEKEAVMRRFRAGDLQLLVSTTVIEVGVDVANATVMVVEHAERFGLSQLHQLRGRVGRGRERAICILVAPRRDGGVTSRRLQVLRRTHDGFRIAEADLDLRGPGEFLGTRQSGLPDFRVSNLIRDTRLLVEARQAAERWLERDPDLSSPESADLLLVLRHRWAGRLGLAEIG